MKILVTGAGGFIGKAVVSALLRAGDQVVALTHQGTSADASADITQLNERAWATLLSDVDAVVNCAGIFADRPGATLDEVNYKAALVLFRACAASGVRRIVQLSAIGVEAQLSPFARSKLEADRALMAMDVDWVILRPSIVFSQDAGGGGALLLGLAALPVSPIDPDAGEVQIVCLEDVVETVVRLTRRAAPARIVLDLVGSDRLSFADTIAALRAWLGRNPAHRLVLPRSLMRAGYALGDLAGLLGWTTPVRQTARKEMRRGATGDPRPWQDATGLQPGGFRAILASAPPSRATRSYATLYFLQPLVIAITSLFFVSTGVSSVSFGYEIGVSLLRAGGMGELSGPAVLAGGVADIVVGLMIAWRSTARLGLYLAIGLSLFYLVCGTILLPGLWRDPIGPMFKIFPLIVLNLVALAMVRGK